MRADGGVSFLIRELGDGERDRPMLSWRWRVDAAPPATDLGVKGADDRALAIHVWYPPAEGTATFSQRLTRLFGYPAPGFALTYVWGGAAAAGSVVTNPYMEAGRLIVLRPSGTPQGQWFDEQVDPAADFAPRLWRRSRRPARVHRYFLRLRRHRIAGGRSR
ncbi:MAG: DUF3047 domain-containing protein [Rhodospirillales bacterium]|nr:DUF3047 domain-containing protein [Rhodospirillales bacterium]